MVALSGGVPEADAFAAQRQEVRALLGSADFAEGARAFAEKREPDWTGR